MKKRALLLIAVAVFMAACSNQDTKDGERTTNVDTATNSSHATASPPEQPSDGIVKVKEEAAPYNVRPDYFGNLDREQTETFNKFIGYAQDKLPYDFSKEEEKAGQAAIQVVHNIDGKQISLEFIEFDEDEYKGYCFIQYYTQTGVKELYPVADDNAEEILDFVEGLRGEGNTS